MRRASALLLGRSRSSLIPLAAFVVAVVGFIGLPVFSDRPLETYDLFNLFEAYAQIGLITLGFGLVVIAGEFDLSIIGIFALSGVIAVQSGQQNPFLGVLLALVIGSVFGALQGLLIARFRIPSMPVTLATYIALLGLTRVIGHNQPSVSFKNIDTTLWVQEPVLQVFSPRSLIVLGLFALTALVLGLTRWGRELRALGGDRKASRTSGVPVDRRLVALFAASSGLAVVGGSLAAFNTGAAITDPGAAPLTLGAAGALIGGVALTGGRGSVVGIFAGTMSIVTLQQIFIVAGAEESFTDLAFGLVLLFFVAVNAPDARNGLVRLRARRRTPTTAAPKGRA
ncbi:MAG TPA: ABC transporter permease [Umezawaea sp.]|nr:ABC transporter permease [Umezawaea sp.]